MFDKRVLTFHLKILHRWRRHKIAKCRHLEKPLIELSNIFCLRSTVHIPCSCFRPNILCYEKIAAEIKHRSAWQEKRRIGAHYHLYARDSLQLPWWGEIKRERLFQKKRKKKERRKKGNDGGIKKEEDGGRNKGKVKEERRCTVNVFCLFCLCVKQMGWRNKKGEKKLKKKKKRKEKSKKVKVNNLVLFFYFVLVFFFLFSFLSFSLQFRIVIGKVKSI